MPTDCGATAAPSRLLPIGGFRPLYHEEDENRCPACGQRQWIVGRLTAQCVFCDTALPLDHITGHGCTPRFFTSTDAARLFPPPP